MRLGGGVELAVHVGDGVHQLGGHHERALLAVEEVREHEGRHATRDLPAPIEGKALPELGLLDRNAAHREAGREGLAIDLGTPVELAHRDPLAIEGVRVEGAELVDLALVVPVVDRLHGGPDPVGLLRVGFRERGTGRGRHGDLRGASAPTVAAPPPSVNPSSTRLRGDNSEPPCSERATAVGCGRSPPPAKRRRTHSVGGARTLAAGEARRPRSGAGLIRWEEQGRWLRAKPAAREAAQDSFGGRSKDVGCGRSPQPLSPRAPGAERGLGRRLRGSGQKGGPHSARCPRPGLPLRGPRTWR